MHFIIVRSQTRIYIYDYVPVTVNFYPLTMENVEHKLFAETNKNKVDGINSRALEGIASMPDGFKELIGAKSDMENMRSFIEQIRAHTKVYNTLVTISGLNNFIVNELSEFRTIISLYLLCGTSGKLLDLVIESNVFARELLKADKNGCIAADFRKYGFDLRVES